MPTKPVSPASTYSPAPSVKPAAPVASVKPAAPAPVTHVSVPIATLQAIHDTLAAHTATVAGLIPKADPESHEAAVKAATELRLKNQP